MVWFIGGIIFSYKCFRFHSRVWEDFISPQMKMDLGSDEIYVEEFDIDFTLCSGILV